MTIPVRHRLGIVLTWTTLALIPTTTAASCFRGTVSSGPDGPASFTVWEALPTEFRIAGETHALSRVDALVPDGSGGLWVAQGQDGHIKRLTADGKLRQIVGGSGDGPGEFRSIASMGRTETGKLWAFDPLNRRVSVFSERGELETTRGIPLQEDLPQGLFVPFVIWADLSMLGHSGKIFDGITAPPVTYHFLDEQGVLHHEIMAVESSDLIAVYRPTRGGSVIVRLPVSTGPVIFASRERRGWATIREVPVPEARTDSILLVVTSGTPDGAGTQTRNVTVYRPRVDESVFDEAIRSMASAAHSAGLVPSETRGEVEFRALIRKVHRWPAAQEAVPSGDGFLWLRTGLTHDGRPLYERLALVDEASLATHWVEGIANVRLLWVGPDLAWGLLERETGEEVIVKLKPPVLPVQRPYFGPEPA